MFSRPIIWLTMSIFAGLWSCDEDSFRGGGSSRINPKTDAYDFPCDPVKKASYGRLTTAGSASSKITVEGSFCSVSFDQKPLAPLSIFFVIDISGSMEYVDHMTNGTCNRFGAAQAVLNKVSPATPIVGSKVQQQQVNVGLITFGQTATVVGSTPLMPINIFKSQMNPGTICSESGIATNYDDAFYQTLEQLRNISGPKLVYFISDGIPNNVRGSYKTTSVTQAKEAGINSAKNLQSLSDLTAYFLYLDNGNSDDGETPQQYLTRLASGDPSRVRVMTNAADLANQAAQFNIPEPVEYSQSSVSAVLTGPNGQQKKVVVNMNETDTTGQTRFNTEPFIPFSGNLQEQVAQKLTVTVSASDGSSPAAVTDIIYTRDK